jgi:hypothetical protein
MNINPYLRISLYKITAIYMLLVGIFETNGWRQTAFTKLLWQVDYPYIHFYLPLLFIVIWALVYLVERSFGLTMAAFRLRSRAGVTAWFDVLILLLMIPIAYASAINPTQIPIEYESDRGAIYSPFLIWFLIFTSLAAIQSLSTLGEYRFNRNQPVDPPQTGLPVGSVPDTTGTPVSGNTNPPVPTPVPPVGATTVTPVITPPPPTPSVGSTGAATVTPVITPLPVPSVGATGATTVPQPLITPPPPTPSVGSTGAATVTPVITPPPPIPTPVPPVGSTGTATVPQPLITPPPPTPSVGSIGAATVTPVITPPPVAPAAPTGRATVTRVITPPPVSPLAPTGSATATPPLNTLPPETPVDPAVVVPTSESTPTVAVTEVFPTPTIPIPTVDPTPPVEVQSTLPLGEASVPMSDTQLSVWERIKRLFGVKPPAPTQLVMSEVTATATPTDTPPSPAATTTDAPQEVPKIIV